MKIHVLLLPDPEEYFFSIYIKFVNEKFCVVKNKIASFWWRHRHWTIAWENWLFTRDHLEDKKLPSIIINFKMGHTNQWMYATDVCALEIYHRMQHIEINFYIRYNIMSRHPYSTPAAFFWWFRSNCKKRLGLLNFTLGSWKLCVGSPTVSNFSKLGSTPVTLKRVTASHSTCTAAAIGKTRRRTSTLATGWWWAWCLYLRKYYHVFAETMSLQCTLVVDLVQQTLTSVGWCVAPGGTSRMLSPIQSCGQASPWNGQTRQASWSGNGMTNGTFVCLTQMTQEAIMWCFPNALANSKLRAGESVKWTNEAGLLIRKRHDKRDICVLDTNDVIMWCRCDANVSWSICLCRLASVPTTNWWEVSTTWISCVPTTVLVEVPVLGNHHFLYSLTWHTYLNCVIMFEKHNTAGLFTLYFTKTKT